MNLRETIKKVLNEQVEYLDERTKLEKSVMKFINAYLKGKELPENFYGIVADIQFSIHDSFAVYGDHSPNIVFQLWLCKPGHAVNIDDVVS